MFNLVDFVKNRLHVGSNKKNENNNVVDDQWDDNNGWSKTLGNILDKRYDIEKKAYQNVIEKYGKPNSMSEEEFNTRYYVEIEVVRAKEKQDSEDYRKTLRVIKTARNESEINKAIDEGYKPLIKQVIPSDKIKVMYSLERDLNTGKVQVLNDSWEIYSHQKDTERVIDKIYYYPYHFESPFAAYLVPSDIKKGERVILEDLIEDLIGAYIKMHTYRLDSCEAVWDGEEFVPDYENTKVDLIMG